MAKGSKGSKAAGQARESKARAKRVNHGVAIELLEAETQPEFPPLKDFAIEVCNQCGGLVGWESLREGCCLGGVICPQQLGTRLLYNEDLIEELEAPKRARRGERQGQLRYYLKASSRELKTYGLNKRGFKRAANRFWASRWFWSAGRLGVVPEGYHQDYWRRDNPNG